MILFEKFESETNKRIFDLIKQIHFSFSEPPKSFTIIKENVPIEVGTEITVVDGKLETVHCESRKSNPAPVLQWFLGKLLHKKKSIRQKFWSFNSFFLKKSPIAFNFMKK